MRWKVFYVDGETFSHVEGAPEDAPGGGVAAIASEDEDVGVLVHSGVDFYVYDEDLYGGWYGLDKWGMAQYFARPGVKIVKLGEAMPTALFKALLARLREDPEIPSKSARYPWEAPL